MVWLLPELLVGTCNKRKAVENRQLSRALGQFVVRTVLGKAYRSIILSIQGVADNLK